MFRRYPEYSGAAITWFCDFYFFRVIFTAVAHRIHQSTEHSLAHRIHQSTEHSLGKLSGSLLVPDAFTFAGTASYIYTCQGSGMYSANGRRKNFMINHNKSDMN